MLFPLAVSGIIRHAPSSGSRLSGLGRHGKSRLDLYIDNLNFGDLIIKQVKNIFSQITFNFQRIAYKNTAKLNIKIFFANQTYASISDIYIFFRYRRPICKSNAIRLVHQTIKKTPGQFRRKAKTPAPSCKATKKNESGDRDGENSVRRSFRQ